MHLVSNARQARQKRHSTTQEAVSMGARMGAYRVILTHFSNRYPKASTALSQQASAATLTRAHVFSSAERPAACMRHCITMP